MPPPPAPAPPRGPAERSRGHPSPRRRAAGRAHRVGGEPGGTLVRGRTRRVAATAIRSDAAASIASAASSSKPTAAAARCQARRSANSGAASASTRARWAVIRSVTAARPYTADRISGWRNVTTPSVSRTSRARSAGAKSFSSNSIRFIASSTTPSSPVSSAAATSSAIRVRIRQSIDLQAERVQHPAAGCGQRGRHGGRPPNRISRAQCGRQFDERQRVSGGFLDQPVTQVRREVGGPLGEQGGGRRLS